MTSTNEESQDDHNISSNERTFQGTSKGVSRERNATSHKVIFVDNLPSSMDKNGFIDLFRSFGQIVDFKFLKHKTGAETGYGFVEFRNWEDGRKAILKMNWKLVDQRNIRVIRAKPPTKKVSLTNLYVENVPKSWNDETITAYFSKICKITHARILVNRKNGQSRGVGFVHCYNNDHAKTAIQYVNVENLGRQGGLNLSVKFAKVSKAERKMQRPLGGNNGNQERRKWVLRQYHAENSFQDHHRVEMAEDCKTSTQHELNYLRGGRCHYNQRQYRNGRRSPKFNRNTDFTKKYENRQFEVSNNRVQYANRNPAMDVKESCNQNYNLFLPSHIPIPSNSQVSTPVPINGMIAPALQQTCGDQVMTKTGVSPKINQIAQLLQVQTPPGVKWTHSTGIEASRQNWLSEKQQGQCLKSEEWQNGNYADHVVANDAFSMGYTGKFLYPNNSCVTPVVSNQTACPFQWSPLVTPRPLVGTPVSVASPVPFYGHLVGSPRGIPTNFLANTNQISSPRTPTLLAGSKFQSPNSRAQLNTMYWPQSPLILNQTLPLAEPYTLQQQMPNLSLKNSTPRHINWEEKEPMARSDNFFFPDLRSVTVQTAENKTSDYTPAEAKGTSTTAAALEESSESQRKVMQYGRQEKQQTKQICEVSSPTGLLRQATQNNLPGLQSCLITQSTSIAPGTSHMPTEQVPIPIS